jgi:DNA-binding transcriptional MocR family regulator
LAVLNAGAIVSKLTLQWMRRMQASGKPAYLAIADVIAEDMQSGRLSARDRLPPLRELAADLDLNYTTVARAYAEARRRGLIDGKAGQGSYIRGSAPSLPLRGGSGLEMTMNMPPEPDDAVLVERLRSAAAELFQGGDPYQLLRYQDFGGSAADRAAGAHWLAKRLPKVAAERVLVCPGAHAALTAMFSMLAKAGEMICVESLTYPGVKAIAAQLGIKLHALSLDDQGPSATEFETACKHLAPKALYCNPTLLNPTSQTVSPRRREALAEIALQYSVPIIEDDAYAMLPREQITPMAALAPELTYYLCGLAKSFGAGLRTAYVASPDTRRAQRLSGALRATTVMASQVTTVLATQWITDGTADMMLEAIRKECEARVQMAERHFAGQSFCSHPQSFHLWLPLSPPWSSVEFASYLRSQGVGVVASAAFATDANPPEAVRICLGGPLSRSECDAALALIADTLGHPLHPHVTVAPVQRRAA